MEYIILEESADTALSADLNEWRKMVNDPERERKYSNYYYKKEFFRLNRIIKQAIKEGKIIVEE